MSLFDATFGQGSHEAQPPEVEGVYWVPFRVPWIPGGCELRCGSPPREDDDERDLKLTLSLSLSLSLSLDTRARLGCLVFGSLGGSGEEDAREVPDWINQDQVEPVLNRMAASKSRDLTLRSLLLASSCLLCCLPACLLASAERRNQREMRSLLEELRGAFRGSDVRFVSMLRRYEGQNDVFHYEDRWLGFAKDAAAARRLADLPTNWLPY